MNIGVILGIVIGALIAVLAIGVLLWMRQKGRKRNAGGYTKRAAMTRRSTENAGLVAGSVVGSSSNAGTSSNVTRANTPSLPNYSDTTALPTPEFMIAALLAANPKPKSAEVEEEGNPRMLKIQHLNRAILLVHIAKHGVFGIKQCF
ncbi:hypothetical protein HDU98_001625 [Podochytrium sp. JEL0797]|nr:hypothetical protein HDU98_001625 [Podochytrium sp. JEL0797]